MIELFRKNDLSFSPEAFFEDAKSALGITDEVKVFFDSNLEEKKTRVSFNSTPPLITVGVKEYNWKQITEKQRLKICNTIYHELVHVRDRKRIKGIIDDDVMNSRDLAHFGYMLVDEFIAYTEANEIYPESEEDLNSSLEDLYYVLFQHMTNRILYLNGSRIRTESDQNRFFEACYENCSALIPRYVICGGFSEDKKYVPFQRAMAGLVNSVDEKEKLDFEDYKQIGNSFITNLIYDLPSTKRKIFWENTGINCWEVK